MAPLPERHFGSFVQVFEQPLPSPKKRPFGPLQVCPPAVGNGAVVLVPQSHDSPVSSTPFPQIDFLQAIPGVGQSEPGSTRQVAEHPSPLAVFPSSHFSPAVILPSPHSGTHFFPGTRHCQPGSTV